MEDLASCSTSMAIDQIPEHVLPVAGLSNQQASFSVRAEDEIGTCRMRRSRES